MTRMTALLLFISLPVLAQEVTFEVSPRVIGINEVVQFVVIVSDTARSNPGYPNGLQTGDFKLLRRSPSRMDSTQIINGSYSSSTRYTFSLSATKKGKLTFPAQMVKYKGKTFTSEPVVIDVGDETRSVGRQSRSPFDRRRNTRPQQDAEIFAVAETSRTEFYLGEPIPYKVKVFRTPGVRFDDFGTNSMDLPEFSDFWSEDFEDPSNEPDQKRVRRDGKIYEVFTAAQKRLFPNKTGDIVIPAVEFTFTVTVGGGMSLFNRGQRVRRSTEPLALTIKPLPENGKPDNFQGLVGAFRLEGSLDKDTVESGGSVNLKVDVIGDGNFAAIRNITPNLDSDFEIFEGGTPTVEKTVSGTTRKSWIFALVPKREGEFSIPLPKIHFFNPDNKQYELAEAQSIPLMVTKGEGLGSGSVSGGSRDRSFVAEQNLNFIKLDALGQPDQRGGVQNPSLLVKVLAGFIIIDLLLWLGLMSYRSLMSRRVQHRPKFALANFKRATSGLSSSDSEAYYAGLSQAILNYFGDKWERSGQGISLEAIRERFDRDSIDEGHFRKIEECIEACDLARFTPSSPGARDQLLNKAKETLTAIDEVL